MLLYAKGVNMRAELSEGQQRIYGFIVEFLRDHNYPPTIREIQDNFGYQSNNSAVAHLRKLESKGYITHAHSNGRAYARTIQLVDKIMGYHIIDSALFSKAIADLKTRGHNLPINTAVELLSKLNIKIE